MGFLVRQHVFTAASDEKAASVLHTGPGESVVCDPGLVGLETLETILTGRSSAEVTNGYQEPLALFNGGQRFVIRLSDDLTTGLADLRGFRAVRVLRTWARSDEVRAERLRGHAVFELLNGLQGLARSALEEDAGCYLWVDVDERALF
jgi:hypothetical protein